MKTFFSQAEKVEKGVHRKPEATTGGVLWKKLFLKILQYSQENTCVTVSFQ